MIEFTGETLKIPSVIRRQRQSEERNMFFTSGICAYL
jgi:hypothetical protein